MAYSKEFWGKPKDIQETPAIPLELLAKKEEKDRKNLVIEQGKTMTTKESEEEIKRKLEFGHEQQ